MDENSTESEGGGRKVWAKKAHKARWNDVISSRQSPPAG